MRQHVVVLTLLWCLPAYAVETTTLPQGAFSADFQFVNAVVGGRFGNIREKVSLLEPSARYEPGGGLQGTLTANPKATLEFLPLQLMYGVTEQMTVALAIPINLRSTVVTNLGWVPGDYQSRLGRAYSEDDFWQWAQSMGQPKPAAKWVGNQGVLADAVAVVRYRLSEKTSFTRRTGIVLAPELRVALPTGKDPDPEELISLGTNSWELRTYGDVEARLNASRTLWTDGRGVDRWALGAEVFYAWLRPRSYQTPRGTKNPLLLTVQPYVGDTYTFDPGDWLSGGFSMDWAPLVGPAWATRVSRNDAALAEKLPPLLNLTVGYQYVYTFQSDWQSPSEIWNWESEKMWRPGDRHIFKAKATLSLLRLGVPLQVYGTYETQEFISGKNNYALKSYQTGARLFGSF